ncbi:EamA family transporter [Amycolatopsis sp. NPDC059090]|uniref:EamA family transporter n=1 Tax=unclassified Amycolatopsis TaxID=2618356 RepID=UPI00366B3931
MLKYMVYLALAGLWLCWGTSFPAMRVMAHTLPPLSASGTAFLAAGLALLALRPTALRGLHFRQIAAAATTGICLLGAQGTVALAERTTFAGTAALVVAALPLWVTVLNAAFGERPSRAGLLRVLVGFSGVALLTGAQANPWTFVVAAAGFVWAIGTVLTARTINLPGPYATTTVQLLSGGTVLLTVGVATGEVVDQPTTASWLALSYLALVDSLAGFGLYTWLLRTTSAALVSTYAYAVPILACLISVLFMKEPPRPIMLAGAVLVITSVAAELSARKPRTHTANTRT